MVSSPTSLNAIFFATILLGSRLGRISSVFVLLFQSLLIFGFGPYYRQEMRRYNRVGYEAITAAICLLNFVLVIYNSHIFALLYLGIIAFIALGAPLLFIYAYKFKNDIRGPWDIPNIREYDHVD